MHAVVLLLKHRRHREGGRLALHAQGGHVDHQVALSEVGDDVSGRRVAGVRLLAEVRGNEVGNVR